jgi:fermentation-respiration switch protein FrsA (DUF1100 family)
MSGIIWGSLQPCAALSITSDRQTFSRWTATLRGTRDISLCMMHQVRQGVVIVAQPRAVSLAGRSIRSDSPESSFMGFPIQAHPALVRQANPAAYASPDVPPLLIAHGDEDALVPHHQSRLLYTALRQQRQRDLDAEVGPWLLHIVEGGGHGQRFDEDQQLIDKTFAFLEKYLKGNTETRAERVQPGRL